MIINIFGPSGSGKTTLVRKAIKGGVLGEWLKILTDNKINQKLTPRIALSCMPIPKFRGNVKSYLALYGVNYEEGHKVSYEMRRLFTTIFPHEELIDAAYSERLVETLSAGEMRRLSLLRSLLEDADLRVIDEPFTNSNDDLKDVICGAITVCGNAILLTHEAMADLESSKVGLMVSTVEDAGILLDGVLYG